MSIDQKTALQIRLAVSIALADGEFSDFEKKTIKKWLQKKNEDMSESKKNKLLKELDLEFMKLEESKKSSQLKLRQAFRAINSYDDRRLKYMAMDLAIEVMVADTKIHSKEVDLIDEIVAELDLNAVTAKKYIHKQILNMDKSPINIDIEGLLNINPTVSNKVAKNLLQKEFVIWNSATTSSTSAQQRENSQKMISFVSKCRERYA